MTKEEAIETIKDICLTTEQLTRIEKALECLLSQLSLPSNLDEAAEEIASDIAPTHPDIDWDECFEKIKDGIKAGAEWMAGQGYTKEAVVGMATEEISINVSQQILNELDLCPGDKVVVQIRKK